MQPITLRALLDGEHRFVGYLVLGLAPALTVAALALTVSGGH